MENTKTSKGRGTLELIVELITAAAVLAGIYLVMVELRQGREISTVEMIHKRIITNIEHDSKAYGENISDTLAKACANTQTLTGSEQTQLHYYFQNKMRFVFYAYAEAELGSFGGRAPGKCQGTHSSIRACLRQFCNPNSKRGHYRRAATAARGEERGGRHQHACLG